MDVWKVSTLVFASSSIWLGWPESPSETRHPLPARAQGVAASETTEEPSRDIDLIAAIRAGEIELAEGSLYDPRPRVARAALEALFRAGATDVLVAALTDDAPYWRTERIVHALGWIGDELSVRTLSDMLDEEDAPIHHLRIADALGTTASPAALPALRRYVERIARREEIERALAAVAYLAIPEGDRLMREWAGRPGHLGYRATARLDPESSASRLILADALKDRDVQRVFAAASALQSTDDALHQELIECATTRTGHGGDACLHVVASRGDADLVSDVLLQRPNADILTLAEVEAGRVALRRLSESDDFETRLEALTALAPHDDDARRELLAAAAELGVNARVTIGRHLLDDGVSAGVDLLMDALLDESPEHVRRSAIEVLKYDEAGLGALRSLARRADGVVGADARSAVLARGELDVQDLDILSRALDEGDASAVANLPSELPEPAIRLLMEHVDDARIGQRALQVLSARLPLDQALQLAGDDLGRRVDVMFSSSQDSPALDAVVREVMGERGLQAALNELGDRPAVRRVLAESLHSRNAEERALAVSRAELDDAQLEFYLRDRDPSVRASALDRLRHSSRGLRAATEAVRDADPTVRLHAVEAIRDAFDPHANQALIDAMRDPDDQVAIEATRHVINSLGGDALREAITLAQQPGERGLRIAQMVLSSGYELDRETRTRLLQTVTFAPDEPETHARVIQLEEIALH